MDIKGNSLFAQMQSMAVDATANRTSIMPTEQPLNTSQSDFGALLKDAVGKVNDIQQETGAKRKAFEMGDDSVSLADVMISSQKSSIAFEATVQVRNKFVEAYKEIMSMPV